jgi:hypothetical protein
MSEFIEIIDRHGRRRRARKGEVLADGERFSLPMQFMDAAAREVADHLAAKYGAIRVIDGSGVAAGHKPGFLYDSVNAHLHDAATISYQQRSARMRSAWRDNKDRQADVGNRQHDGGADERPPRAATLAELCAKVDQAREARDARMRNAWKRRDG